MFTAINQEYKASALSDASYIAIEPIEKQAAPSGVSPPRSTYLPSTQMDVGNANAKTVKPPSLGSEDSKKRKLSPAGSPVWEGRKERSTSSSGRNPFNDEFLWQAEWKSRLWTRISLRFPNKAMEADWQTSVLEHAWNSSLRWGLLLNTVFGLFLIFDLASPSYADPWPMVRAIVRAAITVKAFLTFVCEWKFAAWRRRWIWIHALLALEVLLFPHILGMTPISLATPLETETLAFYEDYLLLMSACFTLKGLLRLPWFYCLVLTGMELIIVVVESIVFSDVPIKTYTFLGSMFFVIVLCAWQQEYWERKEFYERKRQHLQSKYLAAQIMEMETRVSTHQNATWATSVAHEGIELNRRIRTSSNKGETKLRSAPPIQRGP